MTSGGFHHACPDVITQGQKSFQWHGSQPRPSSFTLKAPAHPELPKISVHPLPLLAKKQISLRDNQWLFSLLSFLFPLPVQDFIFCPSYPLLMLFSLLMCLCPLLPTLPLLSSSCPAPVPRALRSQTLPSPCCRHEAEGSDRRSGQLEFVWHDSFPLCKRLVLLLWWCSQI